VLSSSRLDFAYRGSSLKHGITTGEVEMATQTVELQISRLSKGMDTKKRVRITQSDELDQVVRDPTPCCVVLELPSLASDETAIWQQELNKRLNTCGCGEAAAALLISLGTILIVAFTSWNSLKDAPFFSITIAISCLVSSVAIGKIFGKLRGRRRLVASVGRLQRVLKSRLNHHDVTQPSCGPCTF
jgi:hypothetical protein